jgi:hypothetical protein
MRHGIDFAIDKTEAGLMPHWQHLKAFTLTTRVSCVVDFAKDFAYIEGAFDCDASNFVKPVPVEYLDSFVAKGPRGHVVPGADQRYEDCIDKRGYYHVVYNRARIAKAADTLSLNFVVNAQAVSELRFSLFTAGDAVDKIIDYLAIVVGASPATESAGDRG